MKTFNAAIVGGGSGCKAIMDMIFAETLSQLRMKLIGVSCTNPKAVGYCYAQEKGIYTTEEYRDLYEFKDLNMIVELTGRDQVANEICRNKPDHVRLMDHVAARLFWDVFQIEEERIAERKRTEEALRKAHDELEQRVEERTDKLARRTEQLKIELMERKRVQEERKRLISELRDALAKVKTLSGLLPICSSCKKVRDNNGYWNQIEAYIRDHSEAEFSHSICPECRKKLYPELDQRSRSAIDKHKYSFDEWIFKTTMGQDRRIRLERRRGVERRSGIERRIAAA